MQNRKLVVIAGACLALGLSGVAVGKSGHAAAAPSKVTIKQKGGVKMVPNRYVKDLLRFDKDTYTVKSGGTLHLVDSIIDEGPHTMTVVAKKDLPKNAAQTNPCKVCDKVSAAMGVDPNNQEAPPKFFFLENGTGSSAPPSVDRPGDSALIGPGEKPGESVDVKVTAKKGTTLYFMCIIHPQMQGKIQVK